MTTTAETTDDGQVTSPPPIPEDQRPQATSLPDDEEDSSGAEPDAEYHPSGRKVRSDKGQTKGGTPRKKMSGAQRRKLNAGGGRAAQGATMLYGGLGVILAATMAPAAGLTMQGLADEAGPEISKWARDHSPRFYGFLTNLADVSGPGKYLGAPMLAEAHARTPQLRPALDTPLTVTLGPEGADAIRNIGHHYDLAKAEQAAQRDAEHQAQAQAPAAGESPLPVPEPPTPEGVG